VLNISADRPSTRMMNVLRRVLNYTLDRWSIFNLLVAGVVSIPPVVVLGYIFVPAGEVWSHLVDTVLREYVLNTLKLMAGVGTGSLIIGVVTAWLCTMYRFPGQRMFEWLLILPMAMPAYIIAYTYTGMFEFAGPVQTYLRESFGWGRGDYWFQEIRSMGGAIVVMSLVLYPYVYLLSRSAFLGQSVCMLEVSRTMGYGRWQGFVSIALPLARPAIVTGLSLVMMETISDYGTVEYFGIPVFTTGIFRTWFGLGDLPSSAQLASLLLIFVFVLVAIERFSRGRARYHHTSTRYRAIPTHHLKGVKAVLGFTVCLIPLSLGFLLPGIQLGVWAVQTAQRMLNEEFIRLVVNTLIVAGSASILTLIIATLMAYGLRVRNLPMLRLAARVATIGYAIPGTVIAVGVFVPFTRLDRTINSRMEATFNISTGLILSGTIFILLFAYLVRFLTISFNTVDAGFARITPSMSDAAQTLGLRAGSRLIRIEVPVIKGSLLTALVLVFIDVMKELPATLILRPFNFNTLAVRAFELASDERLADSAGAALAIVTAGIIPVILLSRAITSSRPGHSGR